MVKPEALVRSIHFEDFSGRDFERLGFAYVLRRSEWKTIDWYGQLGGDGGRDIWGVRPDGEAVCYQCANHQQLEFEKARADIQKLTSGPNGMPDCFVLISGHRISATMRDRVMKHAMSKGIKSAEIWSGEEFEERLRRDAPVLLKRFVEGEPFPEPPDALRAFGTADHRNPRIPSMSLRWLDGEDEVECLRVVRCPRRLYRLDAAHFPISAPNTLTRRRRPRPSATTPNSQPP
jgi:hypothetical protein